MADRISYEVDFSAKGAQTLWNEFLAGSQSAGRALNESLGGRVKKELFLEVKADDSGVKRVVAAEREVLTELQKIINLQEKANRTQQGSVTSLRQQVNEAKQARDGMVKYASAADGVFVKVGKINGAWDAQNAKVRDLQKQLDIAGASNVWQKLAAEYNLGGLASAGRQISELVNVFQSVSIIVGQVIGSVNQLFDALQRLQSIKLTFEGIGKGGDVGKVFSESSRIALGLGVSLNTVRDGFQQLSPVILATGGNINDVSAITESLSSRFVTFGLSADKSRRVMNGVVQAFSKGKLMAEELTQQISEADPAFRTDLANAIGVTVQELGEMVKAGEVTNAVLLEAIPRMTKASGLFGKLGDSALDAAQGFREGGVTVEQFRNQIATIEQLSLENLVNPETGSLQPLLASLLELRAVVTDVGVAFANSEIFKTFIVLLGSVASQISFVIQTLVKLVSAVASITQPIFGVLNAIDSLGGLLQGFGAISSLVAGIIVTKLVASLVTLGSGAIVGAATAAITGLTKAIVFFSSGAAVALANSIGATIVQLLGLTTAAAGSTTAQAAAATATTARATAGAFLLKQLGLQAAAEALATSAAGTAAAAQVKTAGGIVITGAAATAATPPVAGLAAATTGLSIALSAAVLSFLAVAAGAAFLVAGLLLYQKATKDGKEVTSKFNLEIEKIKASSEAAKKGLESGSEGVDKFATSLKALDQEREKLESRPVLALEFFRTGGPSADVDDIFKDANIQGVTDAARGVGAAVKVEMDKAKKAVEEYNAANDKSGVGAKKVSQDITASQSAVSSALEITRAKREALLEAEAKDPGATQKQTVEKLKALDAEIKKIEQLEKVQAGIRADARKKGIVVDVELNVKDAAALTGDLQEKLKGLKASIVLETNPAKRAELQGDLNALTAQLQFLEGDKTEIIIEANFKIDTRALKDQLDQSAAFIDNLKAVGDKVQSVFALQTAGATALEKAGQNELDKIKERLDGEKEIRDEKIKQAEEAGASEATMKALKKADRAEEKAGKDEIKQKEAEIEAIAERKRQIERDAIQAKINALPAQQEAERTALQTQQELAALELERLLNASKRAELEAQGLQIKIGGEISQAQKNNDPEEEQRLRDLYNLQSEYLKLLGAEQVSLEKSKGVREGINSQQLDTLKLQQESTRNGLEAELIALGTADAQGKNAKATQATASAGANAATNARTYAELSRVGAAYTESGAAAARQEADAKAAVAAAAGRATAALGAAESQVRQATTAYSDMSSTVAQLGTAIDTVASAGQDIPSTGPANLEEAYAQARDAVLGLNTAIDNTDTTTDLGALAQDAADVKTAFSDSSGSLDDSQQPADNISSSMSDAATYAGDLSNSLLSLDGKEINVNVNYVGTPGLWTGGPTVGGQTYRINELGKEGFLSSSGNLSPINKPRNALWKAPGKGMVIPAHIMSKLDVPTGRVSTGVRPSVAGSGSNGLTKIARAIQVALSRTNTVTKPISTRSEESDLVKIARDIRTTLTQSNASKGSNVTDTATDSLVSIARDIRTTLTQANTSNGSNVADTATDNLVSIARDIQSTLSQSNNSDSALQEMAAVQAHQALQIGKLSRAVTKLADKDWNVNVGVRNTGSTAYLDALNRRM
jgi:tape measure domain-containing protein